jgi:hypothetical protein
LVAIVLLRERPFCQEMGELVHEQTIGTDADIWRLEECASIASASIEEPVKELGIDGSAEDGSLVSGIILSRLTVEAFQSDPTLQRAWQLG